MSAISRIGLGKADMFFRTSISAIFMTDGCVCTERTCGDGGIDVWEYINRADFGVEWTGWIFLEG